MDIKDFLKTFITKESRLLKNKNIRSDRKVKHYQTVNNLWILTSMVTALKKFPPDTIVKIHTPDPVPFYKEIAFVFTSAPKKLRYEIYRSALSLDETSTRGQEVGGLG